MQRWSLLILSIPIFFLSTDISHAMGMIARVQQMKAMKQQQAQGENQEGQEAETQEGQQAANAELTYQQAVDARNQAIAQAILNAHNPSVSSENLQTSSTAADQQPLEQVVPQSDSTTVQDVVDLADVWKKLDAKSTVWALLIDDKDKVLTVSEYIDRYHKQGVKINEPPEHYVQMIDQISTSNPQMLNRPFGELIQTVAIIDYDFDNGMDKDTLAKAVLGEQGFEENKRRFSQGGAQHQ